MDPRLVKGLIVLAGIGLYFWGGGLPPTFAEFMQQFGLLLVGGAGLRRYGDLEPLIEDVP